MSIRKLKIEIYSRYLKNDSRACHLKSDAEKASSLALQARLNAINREHGDSMLMASSLLSMPSKPVDSTPLGTGPDATLCSCGTTSFAESSRLSIARSPPVASIYPTGTTRTSTGSCSIMSTLGIFPRRELRPCQKIGSTNHREPPRQSSSLQRWCVDLD